MTEQKGKGYQRIRSIEAFEYEIQEMNSNIAITEKNEKQYARLQLSISRTQGKFLYKVTPDIEHFTDEPVIHIKNNII